MVEQLNKALPLSEVVSAEGHLIDSHLLEQIFDTAVEYGVRYEVEEFSIGRTNADASHLRMRLDAPTSETMERVLAQLLPLGCTPVEARDAVIERVEKDTCAPDNFYSTTNHKTEVRLGGKWVTVDDQRMDAMIVVKDGRGACRCQSVKRPPCGRRA